jgi:formate dehydrogenase major subunit
MADGPSFTLDDRPLTAKAGETIWQAACRYGLAIPRACLSTGPDFRPDGNCRLCVVEVEGYRTLQPSCLLRVGAGMIVRTKSERARHARQLVMELLLAEGAIDPDSECGRLARAMGIAMSRFPPTGNRPAPDRSHPGIAVDLAACIRCMRCMQACREVEVNDVIGSAYRGARTKVVFDLDDPMGASSCVSCGACAQACPTGAIRFAPRQ